MKKLIYLKTAILLFGLLLISCEKGELETFDKSNFGYVLPMDNDIRWNYAGLHYDAEQGKYSICTLYQYYLEGDTLIENKTFYKLWSASEMQIINRETNDTSYIYKIEFKGGIRQNIENSKVYYYINDNEELLYDFNLNIGDTLNTWITRFSDTNIVTEIDTIEFDGKYHKVFTISSNSLMNAAQIIEGIGCDKGLVNNMTFFQSHIYLKCVKVDGKIIYEPYQGYSKDIKELANQ